MTRETDLHLGFGNSSIGGPKFSLCIWDAIIPNELGFGQHVYSVHLRSNVPFVRFSIHFLEKIFYRGVLFSRVFHLLISLTSLFNGVSIALQL